MPPLTPPAWTSLMTGKRPGEHGVFDFFQKETPDSEYFHFASSQDVRSATIWSLASEHGKRVDLAQLPAHVPAAGRRRLRRARRLDAVAAAAPRLPSARALRPAEDAPELRAEGARARHEARGEGDRGLRGRGVRRLDRAPHAARAALVRDRPLPAPRTTSRSDLVAVMFDGPDKLQHLCWRFIDPACRPEEPSPWEAEIIALCERLLPRASTRSSATSSSSPARTRPSCSRRITASARAGTSST